MSHHFALRGLAAALLGMALAPGVGWGQRAQTADELPAAVATAWFDVLYDVIKTEQHSAPVAARTYGLAAVALYEAVVLGSRTHQPLAGQLNGWPPDGDNPPATSLIALLSRSILGLTGTMETHAPLGTAEGPVFLSRWLDWPTAANSALARVLQGLFPAASPASLAALTATEQAFASEARARVPNHVYVLSVVWGHVVGDVVLAWARTDGFATLNDCPYTPPTGPGLWEPTPPAFAPPLQPCWGQLHPVVLTSGEACAPPPPPAYDVDPASSFYALSMEVYTTNVNLTEEQRTIAYYWADLSRTTGTPPGHWIAIVGQLARREPLSLMTAAEAFARVGLAVADAFISCWHTKYTYNLLRPETYIRRHIDPNWVPLLITPGFPAYTSGHATQSGAAATVLTDLFELRPFTDTLHQDHNLEPRLEPRSFGSFEEAAEEAARSRLYAGIHYPFDSDNGLAQGRCVGQAILDSVRFTKPERELR
jgi:PAP2 superfamily